MNVKCILIKHGAILGFLMIFVGKNTPFLAITHLLALAEEEKKDRSL